MRALPLLLLIATLAIGLFPSGVASANAPVIVPTFITPWYVAANYSFRITFVGTNFNNNSQFRLTDNISTCDTASVFNLNAVPTSTLGSIILKWNVHAQSKALFVGDFFLGSYYGAQTYVCYSSDAGRHWKTMYNKYGRPHFQIFPFLPIATYAPKTVVVGRPLYVYVTDGNATFVSFSYRAMLVTRQDACDMMKPDAWRTQFGNWTYKGADGTYAFTPRSVATQVFLCVASRDTLDWSLVPFDSTPEMNWGRQRDPLLQINPMQPKSPRLLDNVSISVNPQIVSYRLARVDWSPTLAAGMTATATISLFNKTGVTLSASDFTVSFLSDGSGTKECPLPTVLQSGAKAVTFSFVPQRSGREGRLSMTYKGYPLLFMDNVWNREALALPNRSKFRASSRTLDQGATRFMVQPGYAALDSFPYASMMRLGWFTPLTGWQLSRGVPAGANGTSAWDEQTATLKPGVTWGVISDNATIPAGATKCRMRVDYFYNGTDFDYTTTQYIGRVSLIAKDATNADVATLKTFTLYIQGRTVVVMGGPRMNGQDGDVMSWERVGFDFQTMPQFVSVRLELEIYHGAKTTLLYGNPYFGCSVHARTPPQEVAALKRIFTNVGSSSTQMQRWLHPTLTTSFNGDPCLNFWRGITCRNLRVIEIDLSHSNLTGQFPPIPELIFLEHLDLRNNTLTGTFPKAIVNNTRLIRVYLGQNRFSSIPSTAFTATTNKCLKVFDARRNSLTAFPYQLVTHPAVEQIDLSFNSIRGALINFPPISRVRHFDVSSNTMRYYLPSLPETALISADFSGNQFVGQVPKQWGNLKNVEFLDVSKNRLNGTIPAELAKISSSARLTFRGYENYFRGVVPSLPFLRVDVRGNSFGCPMPIDFPFVRTSGVVGLDEMSCDYG